MFYDKKIRYLDYLENGEKISNGGFVKIEVTDKCCNIQISVSGLYSTDTCEREVWIGNGYRETVLEEIMLQNGRGNLSMRRVPIDRLGREPMSYEDLTQIRIQLGRNRAIRCQWQESVPEYRTHFQPVREIVTQGIPVQEEPEEKQTISELLPVSCGEEEVEETLEQCRIESRKEEQTAEKQFCQRKLEQPEGQWKPAAEEFEASKEPAAEESEALKELRLEGMEVPEGRPVGEEGFRMLYSREAQQLCPEPTVRGQEKPVVISHMAEDKWTQLSDIYPHIRPFHDEREYLSLGPRDFVILQKQYHKLVNNSFLLHGFYNYEHLILTRVIKKGLESFYIGVPGNFYEREKQVAVMFGFESFECQEEPARPGAYGYFMMKVDI